uniref:Tyrosine specific protein phosphatases domain-containing protein n=1 Tax=Ananas comosus var. bracteatus TaxID=296719 RepID=A0A6V7QYA3_ANACO
MGISKMVGLAAATLFLASICLKLSRNTLIMVPILFDSLIASLVAVASHNSVNFPLILERTLMGDSLSGQNLSLRHFCCLFGPMYIPVATGGPAVIDCTCELPRSSFIPKDEYLCIATWDTRSPSPSQIESAVRWACRKRAERKPIYVHCAFGHGRSVCIMSALLVALGLADDWKEAEKIIREKDQKSE